MITKLHFGALSFAFLGVLTACGNGGGGTGGSGTGGSGTGGAGTGGSTGSGSGCYPQCFLDAFSPCPLDGTCIQQNNGTTSIDICYASGVKEHTAVGGTSTTLTIYKMDKSVCLVGTSAYTSTTATSTYKDGNGTLLFTDEVPLAGSTVQKITCGGKTYMVDSNSAACKGDGGMGQACTMGTCTIP